MVLLTLAMINHNYIQMDPNKQVTWLRVLAINPNIKKECQIKI